MMPHPRPAARHLRLVTDEPAPLDAKAAREAVGNVGLRKVLELTDALAALIDAHDDPAAAAKDVADLRRNIVGIVDYTFAVAEEKLDLRRCAP